MRWGKWGANFTINEYRTIIDNCLHNGITSFDHANIYGDYTTEAEFGEVLKDAPSLRQQMQLITKCGIQITTPNMPLHQIKSYNTSREYIIASTEQSLKNFCTDYIDVMLIHRPDPLLNPEEVAGAITTLQQQGKILQFGVSNFLPYHIDLLQKFIPIQFNQVEVSIVHLFPFTNGILEYCLQHKIIPMAWAPLGGGILNDDTHPRYRSIAATASKLAEKYLTGINQILIAFLLMHPSKIVPVLGTTRIERLLQANEAANIKLEREDWFKLYTASTGEVVP
jgi:predicted oxidoreductase